MTFNGQGLSESDLGKDANVLLMELNKGLQSTNIGIQCKTIAQFPSVLEKYPFPVVINSILLKITQIFCNGNNYLRLCILRACTECRTHFKKLTVCEDIIRKLLPFTESNDPTVRALTLRLFGILHEITRDHLGVHHAILKQIESHYEVESDAAIWACHTIAPISSVFAASLCPILCKILNNLSIDLGTKLKLIYLGKHMHHDSIVAKEIRQCLTAMLETYNTTDFVTGILDTLTVLEIHAPLHVNVQIDLLIKRLSIEKRPPLRQSVLWNLLSLAENVSHHFEKSHILELSSLYHGEDCSKMDKTLILKIFYCLTTSFHSVEFLTLPSGEESNSVAYYTPVDCIKSALKDTSSYLLIHAIQLACKLTVLKGESDQLQNTEDENYEISIDNDNIIFQFKPGQLIQLLLHPYTPVNEEGEAAVNKPKILWYLYDSRISVDDLKCTYNLLVEFFSTFPSYASQLHKMNFLDAIKLDFSLLSLNNKLNLNEVDDNQIDIPVENQNGILATTECYDRLCWQGQLQLALQITDNCIRIQVIKARYLQVPVDEGYTMFVEIRIAPKYSPNISTYQLRTKSVPDCTAPVFNENFSFEISHVAHNDRLYIELYLNQSKFGYENAIFLGGMSFDIERLRQKSIESLKMLTDSQDNNSMNMFKTLPDLNLQENNSKCDISEYYSTSLPSFEINSQDFPKPQWYYLLGQNSCYCRHMSVGTIPRLSKLETHEQLSSIGSFKSKSYSIPSTLTTSMNDTESFSTLSSVNLDDNRSLPPLPGFIKKQITIPKSESGYGFTLTSQMIRFDFHQFASTPITSSNSEEKCNNLRTHKCFLIHSVQKNSPADQVGLPVGAYILSIGNIPLNCSLTLKQVVKCMCKSAENHPNQSIILDIYLPDSNNKVKANNVSTPNSNEESNSLIPSDLQTQTKNNINGTEIDNNNNDQFYSQHNRFSYCLPSTNCITTTTTTTTTANTDSYITSTNHHNSYLPQTITTTAGSVMLCEECCIDESISYNDNNNHNNSNNGNGSLTRRTRILTLAPPLLNLKWEDVCFDEANRQWAIEALIMQLINISNNLISGINAYRTGLQKMVNLHTNDLNSLFYNIVEIASQTYKLKQNLQNSCLPYAVSNHTSPSTSRTLTFKQDISSNKNKLKPSLSSSESMKTDSRISYNNNNNSNNNNNNSNNNNNNGGRGLHKRLSFLHKLRKSFVSSQQPLSINRENSEPIHHFDNNNNNNHNNNWRASLQSEHCTYNSVGEQPMYKQKLQGNQMNQLSHNLSSCQSNSSRLSSSQPPIHGHLDNPGTIILSILDNLLNQCIDYTNVYPDRLKYFYELRKQYPELKMFLKSQSMEPGVPILSLFLTLPSEIPRCLLTGLKNIEKFTSDQHKDRPALEKCIKTLSDALTCQSNSHTSKDAVPNVDHLILKDLSSLSNSQSTENDYQLSSPFTSSASNIRQMNYASLTSTLSSIEYANSPIDKKESNMRENPQLAKLMKYILPPLFPYPNELLTFNASEWSSIDHYIIYKSYLICTLCSKQYPDLIVEDTSYRGPVFAYLLNDAILLVVSDKDVLDTCKPSCLAYKPITFDLISFQDYDISALSFLLILTNGTTLKFDCATLEIKLVWKTLIQQQITINHNNICP
ncbi:unnamed protein product [Schistosoma turkestanicum]|nr:unnamed protein product [Schistosoma turkestanicum]